MIYNDLSKAKENLEWLFLKATFPLLSVNRLSTHQYKILEDELIDHTDDTIFSFIATILDRVAIKTPEFSTRLETESLPLIALVPAEGVRIIIEQLPDGSWKYENANGIARCIQFPKGTFFSPLESVSQRINWKNAASMFKNVALDQKKTLIQAAVASLSINIIALSVSFYSMQVYDRVIPTQGISTLMALTIGVFIAVFLEMVMKIARSSLVDHASENMDTIYSNDIFKRFLSIRCDALPKSVGTISGQLQGYGTVRGFITSVAMYLLIDFPFAMIFLFAIIGLAGWMMGGIVLAFFIVSLSAGFLFRHKIDSLSRSSSMASHKKLGILVETVEGAETIKSTGSGWSILQKWNALSRDSIRDDIEIRHYSEIATYMAAFFQQISYVTLIATGAYIVSSSDHLTMGGLIAVSILSGRVLQPVGMIPNLFVQWGRAKFAIKDLDRVYEMEKDNEGLERPISPSEILPSYYLKDIIFDYGKDASKIKVASLSIEPGEKIAILGMIGSGKSTLLKILAGLYKPAEGKILLGGLDMHHVVQYKVAESIGYLPQAIKLFSGTLRDNLLLGLVGISDDAIMEASQKSGLYHLVNSLPLGLDTPVPEGGESVSGGQKQMIALTRLLLQSPKIWLLDEPTASMDDSTERKVLSMLHSHLTPSDTMIVVTHKMSILSIVDRIILFSPDGILMDGNKHEVLAKLSANTSNNGQNNHEQS